MIMNDIEVSEQLIKRTIELVETCSIVQSVHEKNIADRIFSILSDFVYFKKYPQYLQVCPVKDDPFGRYSVIALLKNPDVSDTVLGIGHFDTVPTEDYGPLKPLAHQPNLLKNALKDFIRDPEILRDLDDENFLFGRGSLDMKSGIAIWLTLLEHLSKNPKGKNLMVVFVCDEEGDSKGMIDALPVIRQMSSEFDLNIESAIDTDYTSPQYPKDNRRFIYGGTIGKILVQFLCIGKEAHASDPYAGIDANQLVSALIEEINLNPEYCDRCGDDVAVAPITLSIKDDKTGYSVQTAKMASVSFNVTIIGQTVDQWQQKLLLAAQKAQQKVIDRLNESYSVYCTEKGFPLETLPWQADVRSFHDDGQTHLTISPNEDEREFSLRWVKEQAQYDPAPRIILFLSMPYYPNQKIDLTNPRHREFIGAIRQCAPGYTYCNNYPYISDLSFVSRPKTEDIESLKRLIPGYDQLQRIDWSVLDFLDIPMINLGPWGKDAHKLTERVHIPSIISVYQILTEYLNS